MMNEALAGTLFLNSVKECYASKIASEHLKMMTLILRSWIFLGMSSSFLERESSKMVASQMPGSSEYFSGPQLNKTGVQGSNQMSKTKMLVCDTLLFVRKDPYCSLTFRVTALCHVISLKCTGSICAIGMLV